MKTIDGDMKQKRFDVGFIKMTMENNGFPQGLVLKRQATLRECRYILKTLLGINLIERDEYEACEYKEYNEQILETVNKWLIGEAEDWAIMEFAYDCADEQPGMMNMVPILVYLKKQEII